MNLLINITCCLETNIIHWKKVNWKESQLKIIEKSQDKTCFKFHHLHIDCVSARQGEVVHLGLVRLERVQPAGPKVNCVDENESSFGADRSRHQQILDFWPSLLLDPRVDLPDRVVRSVEFDSFRLSSEVLDADAQELGGDVEVDVDVGLANGFDFYNFLNFKSPEYIKIKLHLNENLKKISLEIVL